MGQYLLTLRYINIIHVYICIHAEPVATQELSPELEALCKKYKLSSSDINKEVTDEHILKIYIHMDNPALVASHLCLTQPEIDAIRHMAGTDSDMLKLHTIQKWKNEGILTDTATYCVLLEALLSSRGSNTAAVEVCKLLTPGH